MICLCPDGELAHCENFTRFPADFLTMGNSSNESLIFRAQNAGPPKLSLLKNQKPAAGGARIGKAGLKCAISILSTRFPARALRLLGSPRS